MLIGAAGPSVEAAGPVHTSPGSRRPGPPHPETTRPGRDHVLRPTLDGYQQLNQKRPTAAPLRVHHRQAGSASTFCSRLRRRAVFGDVPSLVGFAPSSTSVLMRSAWARCTSTPPGLTGNETIFVPYRP